MRLLNQKSSTKFAARWRPHSFFLLTLLIVSALPVLAGCHASDRTGDPAAPAASTATTVGQPAAASPAASDDVLTYHNDNARTGQYLNEMILTPANVNSSTFGKVGFLAVQGRVDAEPLYAAQLKIGAATRRVVYVATEHDMVYAFDADSDALLWKVSLLQPGEKPSDGRDCQQIAPEIGVTSTPVIERNAGSHGAMFVVAMSKNAQGTYFQRLHALDLTNGAEIGQSPQEIAATFPGSGTGSKNGIMSFDPKQYEERAALLSLNGFVYTTWSSHCDHDPYSGWIIGYSESTLKQAYVLDLTPNGDEGAIWMSADGPAADQSGNIYLLSGNGTFDTTLDSAGFPSRRNFGNAFLKMAITGGWLSVVDYFTAHDTVSQSNKDEDLGSGGLLLLPELKDAAGQSKSLAVGAGKDQTIYVADRRSMGKFGPNSDRIYQAVSGGLQGGVFAAPAYFNGSLYYGAVRDNLKLFPIAHARVASQPSSQTNAKFEYPGTTPSVSAHCGSNGIVWAVEAAGEAGDSDDLPGILHAYDAANLAKELYSSIQSGAQARFSDNKFITPMIAGGRVYVGTPTGVVVFGLLKR